MQKGHVCFLASFTIVDKEKQTTFIESFLVLRKCKITEEEDFVEMDLISVTQLAQLQLHIHFFH